MTSDPPGTTAQHVLLVEDEAAIRRFLRVGLEAEGYALEEAVSGDEGLTRAAMRAPDLVLLDLGLPDQDGMQVLQRLREWSTTPVIVLTARGQEQAKVEALDAGADDYVTKPFSMPELLARMRVAFRHRARVGEGSEATYELGALRIDLARRQVTVEGSPILLTPIEFRLLATLARHAGRVLTHDFLLREVWGPAARGRAHYVRVHMSQLRRKLESDPAQPKLLLTELGVGYRLRDE